MTPKETPLPSSVVYYISHSRCVPAISGETNMDESLPAENTGNLQDYQSTYKGFDWSSYDSEFDWSRGGPYNLVAEAIDRHGHGKRRNKVALYSVNANYDLRSHTFGEMSELSSRFASGLTKLGAVKGDRIFVYLDRTPQLFVALLGIIKMGGVAGPLFSALGPEATMDRVRDSGAKIIITSPYLFDRIRPIMDKLTEIETYIIVGENSVLGPGTVKFDDVMESGDPEFKAVNMNPEDPYIIHYTSGSTGKPKGILLGHKAMVHQLVGCRYVVDLKDDDIYWCTADPGWVTGTSIGILGPWYLGTSIISYEEGSMPRCGILSSRDSR
jgi:acetyl-CoA synthetase